MRDFYLKQLKENILPFWMKNSIDRDYGGFYTCFENSTGKRISTDKYTWSQGRMVWMFTELSKMKDFNREQRTEFLHLAERGAGFLMRNCRLKNGNCTFVMERDGPPKAMAPDGILDTSIYADCFVVYGLACYAAEVRSVKIYKFAKDLFQSVILRLKSGNYLSEPYPTPAGYEMHGFSMITLMISEQIREAAEIFRDEYRTEAEAVSKSAVDRILDRFVDSNGILHEMIRTDGGSGKNNLFDRFINPGHTIEDMWIVMDYAKRIGAGATVARAAEIAKTAFKNGWDDEFGGLTLYADRDGGAPKGDTAGIESERMTGKILADWDNKLWWVHSEALYTMMLAYRLTGDAEFKDLYDKVEEYAFRVFPNPDKKIGEWIQIRDRGGAPIDKIVALPVKDPFHIVRNMIQIIELEQ